MNYLRSMFLWRGIRLKGIWRRRRAAYSAKVEPPRTLTLQERIAALEPEIKQGKETA